MAGDDPELLQWFKQGDHGNSKENIAQTCIRIYVAIVCYVAGQAYHHVRC